VLCGWAVLRWFADLSLILKELKVKSILSLLFLAAVLPSAQALDFKKINLYHNGTGWRSRTPTLFLQLAPQTESAADVLMSLDPQKKYRCEVKVYDKDWALPTTAVFEIQNCVEKR